MKNAAHSTVWYGELRALKGNTIIIRDEQLPEATRGRVYLYNTERDAIIQYDETIVAPKLFPLSDEEREAAELKFNEPWQKALDQFLKNHRKFSISEKAETKKEALDEELFQDDDDDDSDDD